MAGATDVAGEAVEEGPDANVPGSSFWLAAPGGAGSRAMRRRILAIAALAYTWLVSERNWGNGWVPAINDRRHEGRIFGTYRVGSAIHLSSSINAGSPLPFTPIVSWLVVPQTQINQVRPVYGTEMSGRGTAFLRMDAAALASFRGPWGTRWEAGVGISTVSWGDQAMRVDSLFDGVNSGRPGPPYVTE
jgi:hypothetical protein